MHLTKPHWLVPLFDSSVGPSLIDSLWALGSAFILWHSWHEVLWVLRAFLGVLFWFLCISNSTLEAVSHWWLNFLAARFRDPWATPSQSATEQEAFSSLPPLPLGTLVLVSRPPEWDEVMIAGFTEDHTVAVCRRWGGFVLGDDSVQWLAYEVVSGSSGWDSSCPAWCGRSTQQLGVYPPAMASCRSELASVTGEVHQPGPIGPEPEEAGLWQLEAPGVPRWALEQDHQASRRANFGP